MFCYQHYLPIEITDKYEHNAVVQEVDIILHVPFN